jgi:predicted nucleic acid-binding protein
MSRLQRLLGRRVFFDTSAYFAVANRRDASHASTRAVMEQLVAERRQLFTTNFIVAELHALLLSGSIAMSPDQPSANSIQVAQRPSSA